MGFREDVQRLSAQVSERWVHVTNEETAKQALIIPFIQALGYDVFDPLEVRPEYVSDFGRKKGEKVDYAIFKNGEPIIFIECKSPTEKLELYDAQLARYYNATPSVRLAILTNGVTYKFYSDLTQQNIMDQTPFYTLDMTRLSDTDIETLERFRKDVFDTQAIVAYAEELVYTSNLKAKLKEMFRNPPDEFIRYLIRELADARVSRQVIERFRPIVKKSIHYAILDIVSDGILQQEVSTISTVKPAVSDQETAGATLAADDNDSLIVTTEEELECFSIVKRILEASGRPTNNVAYKDVRNWFSIYVGGIRGWFLRLKMSSTDKHLITRLPLDTVQAMGIPFKADSPPFLDGKTRIFINSPSDLEALVPVILAAFDAARES